ncbi:hypothetical protein MBM_09943 [Drepanopeziza brunnea f. sp. 'multigermtubi' MB_m1]|uniref:Uncharacterized protein n=1 Tax=Marssonina brunnea f. sp. multigermtubi (strain MB_m1) TaxID=1072389 RepID=K1W4P2_MARBU|nr:uncharacterized protein MBM_09943 [Drepanopeziza brunnea f. sp. 'multigermtubi' MB_m1]EKD11920.1 hypothetical protein MBM_09943 [Drepanopeziza brunnea f. sp. 'multigermtubi' MB_m1]
MTKPPSPHAPRTTSSSTYTPSSPLVGQTDRQMISLYCAVNNSILTSQWQVFSEPSIRSPLCSQIRRPRTPTHASDPVPWTAMQACRRVCGGVVASKPPPWSSARKRALLNETRTQIQPARQHPYPFPHNHRIERPPPVYTQSPERHQASGRQGTKVGGSARYSVKS